MGPMQRFSGAKKVLVHPSRFLRRWAIALAPAAAMAVAIASALPAQPADDSTDTSPGGNDDIKGLYQILGNELTPITPSVLKPAAHAAAPARTTTTRTSTANHKEWINQAGASFDGTLRVTVDPQEAKIFVDAKYESLDSLKKGMPLKPGEHTVAASVEGYQGFFTTITIQPLETQTVMIALKHLDKPTGELHVFSYPWAEVFVDSQYQGTTPMQKTIALSEGPHAIMLRQSGFQTYLDTVFVKRQDTTQVKVHLRKTM
jgi:hypothetical protein